MGDYARAEPLLRHAAEIYKKAFGEDRAEYATSLNNLGELYRAMGVYARAAALLRRAMEIRKKAVGEDHPNYAISLNNLGSLYQDMGDYARAEPLLRRAAGNTKKRLGENDPAYAASLNNLGWLYKATGDGASAEPLLRRAAEIWKRALGEDNPHYAAGLSNLALLYMDMGVYGRAEPLLRGAMEIRKKALGEDHPDYATNLMNLGTLYQHMGDYARAEPLLRRAIEIYKKALGGDHPSYATSLNNLGTLYDNMGEYARAEPLLRRAVEVNKKGLGVDHPAYAVSLSNLGSNLMGMGDDARAEPLLKEALDRTTAWVGASAPAVGERQWLELLASLRRDLDAYASLAVDTRASATDLYRYVLDWKGAADARQTEARMSRDQPELRPALDQLARTSAQLAQLAFTSSSPARHSAWRRQLDQLRERKENLEADLAARSAVYCQKRRSLVAGPDEVAAALPAGTTLVDLIDYTHFIPPKHGEGKFRRERRLLAFVSRRGRSVTPVPLGAARPIGEAVATWRQALNDRRPDDLNHAATELGRRVWGPLRSHLVDAHTVLIAADGALMYFPFAALPGSKPASYLIEDVALGYVASGRSAIEALAGQDGPPARGLLAIGDVDFQAEPGRSAPPVPGVIASPLVAHRGGFQPLPGTGPEARLARDLFLATFIGQPADLLTGPAPTEGEIKRRLDGGRLRLVHLGTHGFFESPARIAALRAAVRHEGLVAMMPNPVRDDDHAFDLAPLLRSGVVLAGGGRAPDEGQLDVTSGAPPREDGILTAEEVQSLDLRGTDLVVLSACETGLGKGVYGQGMLGLQRAFQVAGARAVVASLWKVNDAATSVLMEQFYTNLWVKKMPKLEALRQAQITVLKNPRLVTARQAELDKKRGIGEKPEKLPDGGRIAQTKPGEARSDPSLWAAFVLSGDGR